MDNTKKFSGKAAVYQQARPSYAQELLAFIAQTWHIGTGSLVADVGSGTGIFSRQLLELGAKVFAVEPNADMRAKAEELLAGNPNFVSVNGSAEETTLPDHCFHLVSAAAAFHWFDPQRFKQEAKRLLTQGAPVILLWNEATPSAEINQERERIFRKYCPAFKGFSGGNDREDEIKLAFFDGMMQERRFLNPLIYDRQMFINRALSASYSLVASDNQYSAYLREIGEVFDKYAQHSRLEIPQESVLYYKG